MIRQPKRLLRLAADPSTAIATAALLAVLPMLVLGPSCGHDFDFHLLSWLEAGRQFAQGSFPHWAYTPAFNAGEPRFIFYPPLSWSLGAILGLILPWNLVPAAFTWIALTLSGLTFRALARRYVSPSAATLGAILYLANPYMLFTAYERSAFAELLAASWLPLLIAAALAPRVRILRLAVPIALLWLTNAPAAVMSTYALAVLTILRLVLSSDSSNLVVAGGSPPQSRLRLALTTTTGTALGLALAAFYIIPAAYERRFVQINMLVIEGMRVSDHFLFHRMTGATTDDRFHDAVVRTASLIALTLLASIAAAGITLVWRWRSRPPHEGAASSPQTVQAKTMRSFRPERGTVVSFLAQWRNPRISHSSPARTILPLALLTLLIALLLTPPSLPLWQHLPDLAFLQFPWRLTALLGLIFALFTTLALPRRLPTLLSLLIAALMIAPAWHLFHQTCDPEDSIPARVALFHSNLGTEPTDEYTPLDADPDALHPRDPPYWLLPAIPPSPSAAPQLQSPPPPGSTPGPAPHHLTLTLTIPEYLVLNLRDYPAWQITLNHAVLQPDAPARRAHRDDGLITLLLPPGIDTMDLTFIRTSDESLGLLISALALVAALTLRLKPRNTAQAP